MNNSQILSFLEEQRDHAHKMVISNTITGRYLNLLFGIKSGNVHFVDPDREMVAAKLEKLSRASLLDEAYSKKLDEYASFNNESLIEHFKNELTRVLDQVKASGKKGEVQAIFIVYDHYYHFDSGILCTGLQEYPVIESPRYISSEIDFAKDIFSVPEAINFKPAWPDCLEFDELDYLNVNYELEELFRLHSRVLLHKALLRLHQEGALGFLRNRPFYFYINEHDCEVMSLYLLS